MTPSLTLLLCVALFWTLPASVAVLAYRRHDNDVEKMKASMRHSITSLVAPPGTDETKARLDA